MLVSKMFSSSICSSDDWLMPTDSIWLLRGWKMELVCPLPGTVTWGISNLGAVASSVGRGAELPSL